MPRTVRLAIVAAVALASLAGCAGPPAEPPASTAPSSAPAPSAESTTSPTTNPSPTQPTSGTPQACLDQESSTFPNAEGGDAIAAAAATAAVPHDAVLRPGVQVITSSDEPGMLEAVARFCAEPLTRDEVLDIANEIAMAVRADPSADLVSVLVVTAWEPDPAGTIQAAESVRSDFQMFTWDPAAAVPMDRNWE